MSILNSVNFIQQGNTEKDCILNSAENIRDAIIDTSTFTLRSIKIFSTDLEYALYSNELFRQNILALARGNRHAQINILVNDISVAIRENHQLVHLSQQLTSSMQIRVLHEDYQHENISFLIVDNSAFIFKENSSKNFALKSSCKNRVNKLLDFFTLAWEQAIQTTKTQRLHL